MLHEPIISPQQHSSHFPRYTYFHKDHDYHIVEPTRVPAILTVFLFCTVESLVQVFHSSAGPFTLLGGYFSLPVTATTAFMLSLAATVASMYLWVETLTESLSKTFAYTLTVEHNFLRGIILFLVSEVCLFFSVFWAFFQSSLNPSIFLGGIWPPVGIEGMNPWQVPLLNTLLLLTSGATVNNFFYLLKNLPVRYPFSGGVYSPRQLNLWSELYGSLFVTLVLGAIFLGVQLFEYLHAVFSISDGIYGSTFFMATGLHGLHVLAGLLSLTFLFMKISLGEFDRTVGFTVSSTGAVLYWHLVDVVWLFLFVFVYVWRA